DNSSVAENSDGAAIGNLAVVDPDIGDSHTWSVNDARFEIIGTQLKLKAGQSLDFETEPTVMLIITARDQGGSGLTIGEPFTVSVVAAASEPSPIQPLPGLPDDDATPTAEVPTEEVDTPSTEPRDPEVPAEENVPTQAAPRIRPPSTPTIPDTSTSNDPLIVPSASLLFMVNEPFVLADESDEQQQPDDVFARAQPAIKQRQNESGSFEGTSTVSQIDSMLMSRRGELWDDLDTQRDLVESQIQGDMIIVGTAGAAASSFTVGVVAWALRTGFLASGLLAQLPAWRAFDPTLLMQGFEGLTVKQDKTGDEETLEEMMDRQSRSIDE
ncbi:MAG: cadherin repeat domain-containing protein, partial [Rubripirellula sp.]